MDQLARYGAPSSSDDDEEANPTPVTDLKKRMRLDIAPAIVTRVCSSHIDNRMPQHLIFICCRMHRLTQDLLIPMPGMLCTIRLLKPCMARSKGLQIH